MYHVHICVWMCATSVCICLYICICRYVRFAYPRLLRVCNERLCVHMLTPHLSHTQTYMHTYTYIRSIFISHILIILKHIHTCKHRLNWSLLLKLCNPVASARNTDAATYIRYTHTHTHTQTQAGTRQIRRTACHALLASQAVVRPKPRKCGDHQGRA